MNTEKLAANPLINTPLRRVHRDLLLVLAYHGVEDPEQFDRHLTWLRRTRTPISLEQLTRHIRTHEPLPRAPFLITFDDGRRSVLSKGLPVLKRHRLPAVLFVVTDLIGTTKPYWWDEVEQLSMAGHSTRMSDLSGAELVRYLKTVDDKDRLVALEDLRVASQEQPDPVTIRYPHLTVDELRELDRAGVTIGSHSVTHPLLDKCTREKIQSELSDSREMLDQWLDRPVRALAYPNGNVSNAVANAARQAGYDIGFLFDHRFQRQPITDALMISRVRIDATASIDRLKALTSGLLPLTHRLRMLP